MPYSQKAQVEEELLKLVNTGIITKVSHSNWVSPIVVVTKKRTRIRICGNFKKTLNRVIESEHCVLPVPEDIFASLSGNKFFSVIDLKGAYQQLQIGKASKDLLVINTHLGYLDITGLRME